MANEQNLRSLTTDEAREIGVKGGLASAEARRRKRDLRLALEMLLEKDFTDKSGNAVSGTEAITSELFRQAMKGNVKAFETIRATVGQDPVQKIMIAEVDQAVIDEVEQAVMSNEDVSNER